MSCGERQGLAPVVEINWRAAHYHGNTHRVERGETLYAIAFRYEKDYRQLAAINHLSSPYTLRVGQILNIQSHSVSQQPRFVAQRYPSAASRRVSTQPQRPASYANSGWSWPIRGRVVATYAPERGRKGIDIAGRKGESIHAAASGVVAYSGNGLLGYGNLIIIRHDNQYLTAYGNNSKNLVREGQFVRAGQVIAQIGAVDRRFWGLHFEIRHSGKPMNPLIYLR